MKHVYSVEDLREFYQRWGSTILSYCELYLGDRNKAEKAIEQVFTEHFHAAIASCDEEALSRLKLPVSLLRRAVQITAAYDSAVRRDRDTEVDLSVLEPVERSTFILRAALGISSERSADALGVARRDADCLWASALCHLRAEKEAKGTTFFFVAPDLSGA